MKYLGFQLATRAKTALSNPSRAKRLALFADRMGLTPGTRIVDLGGVPAFWDGCEVPLDLTILNLPGWNPPEPPPSHHTIRLIEGDGTATGLPDNGFDIAFSNSVIEHVGPPEAQLRFAQEVRRLAPRYWVQTPSIWFPIEAHSFMPFWWFYPESVRRMFLARWRRKLPAWTEMVAETTVLLRRDFQAMFPEAELWTERSFGWTKSYVAYRR